MVPIVEDYIGLGHPNRPGDLIEELIALTVHYTNNDRPSATDTMNAEYFGRPWHRNSLGKPAEWQMVSKLVDGKTLTVKQEVPFSYGSAQVVADEDSVTETMPLNEVAFGCGDARIPDGKGGFQQQPASALWFKGRPNFFTLSIEICNNRSWIRACENASDWIVQFLQSNKRTVSVEDSLNCQVPGLLFPRQILILRHFDITGKLCPKPFVDHPDDWANYVRSIADRVNS